MIAAFRSQMVKLFRPVVLGSVLAASLGFAVLATVITLVTATAERADTPAPGGGASRTLAELARPDGIVAGLGQSGQFLGIVALVLGAFVVASEYQHGTLRNLLVRQPRRLVLLGGWALATGVVLVLAAALATAGASVAAVLVAPGAGVETGSWSAGEVLGGFGRIAVDMLGFGLFGGVLGLLLRSPVAAIGAGVAYALPIESILAAISSTLDDVLPGRLLAAAADGSASGANAVALTAWVLVGAAVAAIVFTRRDVAA